jgi:drug/metabolite transporter (DMT)-like permease
MPATDTTARLDTGFAGAFAALCVAAVSMGLSPIFVRFAAADVGPFASAFWRVALALPVLYAWVRLDEAKGAAGSSFGRATVLAGAAFAGDLFFWHLSILNTTVANATFFATTAPIFVVLVTWLVLRRRVSGGTVAGLILCCLGGLSLIGQSLDVNPARILGDLFGIATAVFFALYFLAVERAREGVGAARVTFELTLVTTAILLVVALLLEPRIVPRTREGVAALFAMAWISHAGGQGLLSIALGRLPAVFSSLVIFLEAVAAAAFGWMILDERLTPIQLLGGALILAGIWLARPRVRSAPT